MEFVLSTHSEFNLGCREKEEFSNYLHVLKYKLSFKNMA